MGEGVQEPVIVLEIEPLDIFGGTAFSLRGGSVDDERGPVMETLILGIPILYWAIAALSGLLQVRNRRKNKRRKTPCLFFDLLLVFGISVMGALLFYPTVLIFFGLEDTLAPLVVLLLGLSFEKVTDAVMGTSKVQVREILLKWLK